MIQYTIVTIVIAIATAYAIRMLIRTIKVSKNACGGCPGFYIKEQLISRKTTYKYERR